MDYPERQTIRRGGAEDIKLKMIRKIEEQIENPKDHVCYILSGFSDEELNTIRMFIDSFVLEH